MQGKQNGIRHINYFENFIVNSEKPGTDSDNIECFTVKPEATPAYEASLCSENVKEEVQSEVAAHTHKSSEMTVCSEKVPGCDWVTGDLAWAHVSGYPFWPCMITLDPQQRIFTKTSGKWLIVVQT
jgi:histone-lysine N-methyltransferase NSD2